MMKEKTGGAGTGGIPMEREMTERYLRLLNLHSSGLETALERARAGDAEGALRICGDVFRRRIAGLGQKILPAGKETMERADLLLGNRLSLLGTAPQFLGDPIDWCFYPDGDMQWQSHLGYIYWSNDLLAAHAATGDTRYTEKWKAIQTAFLRDHAYGTEDLSYSVRLPVSQNEFLPVYGGEGFCPGYIGGSWISLACASRVSVWLEGMQYLAARDLLEDGILWPVLECLMTDHLHVLMDAPRRGTPNQYISCAGALLRLGTLFWEFSEATAAYFVGMSRVEAATALCVFPDGSDSEQSLNYNTGYPARLATIRDECGLENNPRMRTLVNRGEARCEFLAAMVGPRGRFPDLAKTHAKEDMRPGLEKMLGDYPGARSARAYLDALEGKPSDAPLWADYPYGGYSVMRTGWADEDAYLFFKYSRYSPGHKHEDACGIVLTALGRQLLVDTGNYNYSDDPSMRPIHTYLYSSAGHNTADLDGLSQRRMAMEGGFKVDERWPERADNETEREKVASILRLHETPCEGVRYHSECFDAVQGVYADGWQKRTGESTFEGSVLCGRHERTVIFLRPGAWLIADRVIPEDGNTHDLNLHWHLGPDFRPEDVHWHENGFVTAADGGNLGLWSYGGSAPGIRSWYGSEDPFRGWYTVGYGEKVPAVDAEYTFRGRGTQTVLTLLVPLAPGDAPEVTGDAGTIRASLPGGEMAAQAGDGTLTVFWNGAVLRIGEGRAEEA